MSFLEKPIYHLIKAEPFYANFLLGSSITVNDPKITRAAVRYYQGNIDFMFNTDYMNSLPLKRQVAVLKHEINHVLLEHVASRSYGRFFEIHVGTLQERVKTF
jgi:predicted metal-dependent peptidase